MQQMQRLHKTDYDIKQGSFADDLRCTSNDNISDNHSVQE